MRAASPCAPSRSESCSGCTRATCARSRSAGSSTTSASSPSPTRSCRSPGRSTRTSTRVVHRHPESGEPPARRARRLLDGGAPPRPRSPRAARRERLSPRPLRRQSSPSTRGSWPSATSTTRSSRRASTAPAWTHDDAMALLRPESRQRPSTRAASMRSSRFCSGSSPAPVLGHGNGRSCPRPCKACSDPAEPCGDLVNLENQVGYLRAVGNASSPTRIPFHLLLVQLYGRRVSYRVEHARPL